MMWQAVIDEHKYLVCANPQSSIQFKLFFFFTIFGPWLGCCCQKKDQKCVRKKWLNTIQYPNSYIVTLNYVKS
jgi:hypothetical protein